MAAAYCLIVILLAAGCAGLTSLGTKQETLDERVKNYMQAQIEGKWDQAYSFFHSSYREKVPKENYVHRAGGLSYKGFAIEEISMLPSGNEATVKVKIDLSYMGYVFPRAPQTQKWARENGGWFITWSDKTNPFTQQKKQK